MAFQTGASGEINSVFPLIESHNYVFALQKNSLLELISNTDLNKAIILPDQNWKGLFNISGDKSVLSLDSEWRRYTGSQDLNWIGSPLIWQSMI